MSATIFSLVGRISMQGVSSALKEVSGLENSVKDFQKTLGKLGSNLTKTGTFLSKNLSLPITAVASAIGILSLKTGEYASKLSTLEQQTGLNTDTLQEYEFFCKKVGGSSDALFNSISQLTNKLPEIATGTGKQAEALDKLGINVTNADGSLRSMNDLMPEIIGKLQGVEDITLRNNIACNLFGKSSKELSSLLGTSSEEMGKLRNEAHSLGLVMGEDALKRANDFKASVETLKAQFSAISMEIGNSFIPILNESFIPLIQNTLIPLIHTGADAIGIFAKAFSALPSELQSVSMGLVGVLAAVGPMALVVGKMTLAVKTAIPFLASLGVTMGGVTAGATGAKAALIGLATGIALPLAAIASITTAVVILVKELRTLDAVKKQNAETQKLSETTNELYAQVTAAKKLVAEYEKLKGQSGFDSAELERLKTAHEDTVIALKNHSREMQGKNKLDETEIENTRRRMRGLKELSDADKRQTEFAIAQAKERSKAYAEAAKARLAELNGLVTEYEDKYEKMFMNETELLDYEEAAELKRLAGLEATEEQKYVIHQYFNEKRQQLVDKQLETEADKEKELVDKRDSINKQWQDKVLKRQYEVVDDKIKLLEMEYQSELEAAKQAQADLLPIHQYYAIERNNISLGMAEEQKRLEEEITRKAQDESNKRQQYIQQWLGFISSTVSKIGSIFSGLSRNEETRLSKEYKARKEHIEATVADETERSRLLNELAEEEDAEKLKIQQENAKRQKALGIFSVVVDTASAIMRALKDLGPVLGAVSAVAIGALGAAQIGVIASEPEPFFDGGLIKGSREGIQARIGERNQSEVVLPLDRGVEAIADKLVALQGNNTNTNNYTVNLNVGSLIADDYGIKTISRKIREEIINIDRRAGIA